MVGIAPLKYRLIGLDPVGEVRLHRFVNLGEFLDACIHIRIGLGRKVKGKESAEGSRKAELQAPPQGKH